VAELIVLACLVAEPRHCEEFHLAFLRPAQAYECLTKQPTFEVVQWVSEHPSWTVKKWICGPPRA